MQLSCSKTSGLSLHLAQILCSSVELPEQKWSRGNTLHLERQKSQGRVGHRACDLALQVTWGQDMNSGGCRARGGAKRKAFKGCSLLWSGKLLSVHGWLGFCVWLTDYALRQCLGMGSATAPGHSGAAEGAHPLLQRHLPAPCPAWLPQLGTSSSPDLVTQCVSWFIPFLGCWRWNKRKALHQIQNSYELLIWKYQVQPWYRVKVSAKWAGLMPWHSVLARTSQEKSLF